MLAVATDLPHKNLATLVDGVASLPPAERPLLAFAGRGTDAGRLAALAAELGAAQDVRLLGGVGATELEDLYAAADAFATATRSEGFGLAVLEAMARGVPVACSDLPVLREVGGDAGAVRAGRRCAGVGCGAARSRGRRAGGRRGGARRPRAGRGVHLGARREGDVRGVRARAGRVQGRSAMTKTRLLYGDGSSSHSVRGV